MPATSIRTRSARRLRRYPSADQQEIQNHLRYADYWASQTYDPAFGKAPEEYRALCRSNALGHLRERYEAEARRQSVTDHLGRELGNGLAIEDLLADHHHSAKRSLQLVALKEFLDRLFGNAWAAAIAVLCGYTQAEVARHLGYTKSTFQRRFAGLFRSLRESVR